MSSGPGASAGGGDDAVSLAAVTIRAAEVKDAAAIAQIRVDAWRTTYRGVLPDAYLDAMTVAASTRMWEQVLGAETDQARTFVAEHPNGLVGFAAGLRLAEPRHELDAELTGVYVIPLAQRRGIGRRLLGTVAQAQFASDATGMITWVLSANKAARAFFEALDGELVIEQPYDWDGKDLLERGYGWRDLEALIAIAQPPSLAH